MLSYQISLQEIFGNAMNSRTITSENREAIQNIIWNSPLTKEENAIINRLFYHLRRGFLKFVD